MYIFQKNVLDNVLLPHVVQDSRSTAQAQKNNEVREGHINAVHDVKPNRFPQVLASTPRKTGVTY